MRNAGMADGIMVKRETHDCQAFVKYQHNSRQDEIGQDGMELGGLTSTVANRFEALSIPFIPPFLAGRHL